jgi:hypothetical protein
MWKGLTNEAFKQTRESILRQLSINSEIRGMDYFFLWLYEIAQQQSHKTIQCSFMLRGNDLRYKIIAFNYE